MVSSTLGFLSVGAFVVVSVENVSAHVDTLAGNLLALACVSSRGYVPSPECVRANGAGALVGVFEHRCVAVVYVFLERAVPAVEEARSGGDVDVLGDARSARSSELRCD